MVGVMFFFRSISFSKAHSAVITLNGTRKKKLFIYFANELNSVISYSIFIKVSEF